MKKKGLYQLKKSDNKIKEYTLSVLTEDKAGLLNHITIIFNRRKMNINSLNVSTTEVKGVSRFTIVVESSKEKIIKVVNHINKLIDVLAAFLYEEDEIYYQEIALYKLSSKIFGNIYFCLLFKWSVSQLIDQLWPNLLPLYSSGNLFATSRAVCFVFSHF